jgi:hypothetical protein
MLPGVIQWSKVDLQPSCVENAAVVDLQINHSSDCKIVRLPRDSNEQFSALIFTGGGGGGQFPEGNGH